MLSNSYITELFDAVVEATEEAIVNAVLQAETMIGVNGVTAHGLDSSLLLDALARYNRAPA